MATTAIPKPGAVTMVDAIRQAMTEEMERDASVVAIGEDIGVYGGAFKVTDGLLAKFGRERVIETPIAETAIIGAACGMSFLGLRPVCEMQFIDFIACCFNQVTNFVAKSHYLWDAPVPIVIRGPSGGGVHGGPFHSANPEMYFVHTPGLKVIYPSTPSDAKGLLKSAIRDNNPVLFFEHKYLYRRLKEEMPAGDHLVPIGKAAVRRAGRDLTIISYAAMVHTASDLSFHSFGCQGLAEVGDSRQQSGAVFRAQISVPPAEGRNACRRSPGADWQSGGAARRARPHHHQLCGHGAHRA